MEIGLKEEEIKLKEATEKTEELLDNLEIKKKETNRKAEEV